MLSDHLASQWCY